MVYQHDFSNLVNRCLVLQAQHSNITSGVATPLQISCFVDSNQLANRYVYKLHKHCHELDMLQSSAHKT